MSAWESIWRSVRPTNGRVADEAILEAGRAQSIAEEAADRIDQLAAERNELAGRLDGARRALQELIEAHRFCPAKQNEHKRRADALATECDGLTLALEAARLRPSDTSDQDRRNCVELTNHLAELRAEKEHLERENARLQGRSTEQDWTGGFRPVTTS